MASRQTISQGKTLVEPLTESGVFPSMVCQMISVGETTGALDTMLSKIADFYDDEVDSAVTNLTSLMEPFVIVFLGVNWRSRRRHVSADFQTRSNCRRLESTMPENELPRRLQWFLLLRVE
jgi:hypothetical protein